MRRRCPCARPRCDRHRRRNRRTPRRRCCSPMTATRSRSSSETRPPPRTADAWATWERRGVNQFRLPHAFRRVPRDPRHRAPRPASALDAEGALRSNRMSEMPVEMTGGFRPGDERFEQITGRRPMVEATFARLAAREPGVEIRRDVVVRGLVAEDPATARPARPRGAHRQRRDVGADLVVDAGGAGRPCPTGWPGVGARRPRGERRPGSSTTAGTTARPMGRCRRCSDRRCRRTTRCRGSPVADNGTWSVVLIGSAKDRR